MRIVRLDRDGQPVNGILDGDGLVYLADGDPFVGLRRGPAAGTIEDVTLLPPVQPSKIVAIGLNYLDHITADAPGFERPANPIIFLKPPSSLIGHGGTVILPRGAERVESEAELAVVIGRRARHVPVERALDYVLGFTCSNDVSARDYQFTDGQWTRAKGFDTFTPLGPAVVTDLEPGDLQITCRLNGKVCQQASTAMLLFDVPTLIAFISGVMTLQPGDVIMTGTPAHPPRMQPGDVVEVEIGGIGVLRNPVAAEPEP